MGNLQRLSRQCRIISVVMILLIITPLTRSSRGNCCGTPPQQKNVAGLDSQGAVTPVKLSTTIVNQSYCDTGSIRIKLRLKFTNQGNQPLILSKDSSVVFEYMISSNLKASLEQRYESHKYIYTVIYGAAISETPTPGDAFVIIKPGLSHEVDAVLFLVNQRGRDDSSSLKAGEHYLQIKVKTWLYSAELAGRLSARWASFGYLYTQPATSQPMQFFVGVREPNIQCR